MPDISKISVNETTYDIKDATGRKQTDDLAAMLGALAFKDTATGDYTPGGKVTAPAVSVNPITKLVKVINNTGSLPTFNANVSEETLSFSFNQGAMVSTVNETVVTGIADATASAPVFTGNAATITVQ